MRINTILPPMNSTQCDPRPLFTLDSFSMLPPNTWNSPNEGERIELFIICFTNRMIRLSSKLSQLVVLLVKSIWKTFIPVSFQLTFLSIPPFFSLSLFLNFFLSFSNFCNFCSFTSSLSISFPNLGLSHSVVSKFKWIFRNQREERILLQTK